MLQSLKKISFKKSARLNNPIEQINNINGKQAFLDFVARLAKDAKENPEEWANSTVSDYLNQLASWVEDYSAVDSTADWDNFDYKTLAQILYMGKIYE